MFVTHDVDEALTLGVAVLGRAGRPLQALTDVPAPREDRPRPKLRSEIIAALQDLVAA